MNNTFYNFLQRRPGFRNRFSRLQEALHELLHPSAHLPENLHQPLQEIGYVFVEIKTEVSLWESPTAPLLHSVRLHKKATDTVIASMAQHRLYMEEEVMVMMEEALKTLSDLFICATNFAVTALEDFDYYINN